LPHVVRRLLAELAELCALRKLARGLRRGNHAILQRFNAMPKSTLPSSTARASRLDRAVLASVLATAAMTVLVFAQQVQTAPVLAAAALVQKA
jgi:hypothetical protein